MDYLSVLIIAAIEGLTEYLPVSSTGHMILVSDWLGMRGEFISTFEIFIQLGAILAVVFLYPHRFTALFSDRFSFSNLKEIYNIERGFKGVRAMALIFAGCLPAFVMGALFHKLIKLYLFNSMTVAIALILGGVILVFIESRVAKYVKINSLDEIDLRTSFLIGCFQVCALWPGISRSGATIVGGLICGLNSAVAAEFSFLIAVPLMCIAVTFDLLQSLQFLQFHQIGFFLLGFIVSFIVAVLAVKWFVALLTRIGLKPFGYYRIILGVLVMANYLLVYSR